MMQQLYITFKCEHCGAPLRAPAGSTGKTGKCPKCKKSVVIPEAEEDE